MAAATVVSLNPAVANTPSAAAPSDLIPLLVDSIPTIDLQLLSQSELYTLSLCSPSTFDPHRFDDVIIPKIDRSVFNESAGSRKQTYSRLRLVPAASSDFASVASSSSSSIRHRTPHLRPSSHNPHPQFLDNDPENADNRQIVALLKQLFGIESSSISVVEEEKTAELVPIRVDYSDTMSQSANVVLIGQKRKRGRPRKNENAVVVKNRMEAPPLFVNDVMPLTRNEIVVYENVDEKEEEIVKGDGVEVDLVELGLMEDPYREELRRRTEGMGTQEQLLEFLEGLNGQWASRRKKKRIVDASLLGNALPNGWRLSISCKKKEGHVWLFCRRYISPNGRQFVSCKEISAYLLSLHGIQDANQKTYVQSNAGAMATDKMATVVTGDVSVPNDKREEKTAYQTLSPAGVSTSGNYEVQITVKPRDLTAVKVGEASHCEKCNLNFISRDDFLLHQLSSHRRRRSKNGEYVTDGVIIKGGKFECQFCHKTFNERHRYNGHVGSHIRNQLKNSDESRAARVEECLGSGSSNLVPRGSTMVQSSTGFEINCAAELSKISADDTLDPYTEKQNGQPKELNDHLGKIDNSMDVDFSKSKLCSDSVTVLSNNENNNNCEISSAANVIKNAVDGVEKSCNAQDMTSESCSPFPLDKHKDGDTNATTTLAEPKMEAISVGVSRRSNEQMQSCDIYLDGSDFSRTMNELGLEEDRLVDDETLFGFCNEDAGLADSNAIGYKPHTESEDHLRADGKANGKPIPTATGSEQKVFSESTMLTPSRDEKENRYREGYGIFPSSTLEGGEHNRTGSCGSKGLESDENVQEERGNGSSRIVPSWIETGNVTGMFNKEVSTGIMEGHQQPKGSESSLPSLFGFEGSYGVEEYIDRVSTRKAQQPQVNDAQNMRNSELVFPFRSSNDGIGKQQSQVNDGRSMRNSEFVFPFRGSNDGISADAVKKNKNEGGFEFRAFFPPENGKLFSAENNRASVQDHHALEEIKKGPSGNVLLAQPRVAESSGEAYNMNKIFGTQVDEHKINVFGHSKTHELCLAFDNRVDSSGVNSEKYGSKSFDIHSGLNQTYGAQNYLNIGHVAPKEGRSFGVDLHDSSFADKNNTFQNNFNMVYPGRDWEGPKVIDVGNSGNKFMVGFGSNVSQPVEDVLAGSIWRTGEENLLRPDLADTATPLIQSSNNFHTFDIISDKGPEGLFGVDHKYDCDTGFEGLTLGRTEPMEYSFMTAQSSNTLPGDSKGFSYDTDAQQDFDSSFWLGKDSLMQNMSGQNQVPTICVWCRNGFYQDPVSSGAQTGSMGSMCPACSSRFP